ncbi:MAG: glycosyltransferase [Terracidiphilus sp.]
MQDRRSIVIFRDWLLTASETFIRAQGEGLDGYVPFYVGLRRVAGLELPEKRSYVLSNGSFGGHLKEKIFKVTGYSPRLRRELLSSAPCLIHAHFGFDGTTLLPIALHLPIPFLVTYHGFDATLRREQLCQTYWGRRYLRRLCKLKERCSLFVAVSQFIRKKLLAQGFPDDKICVHYIGIDTRSFSPSPAVKRRPTVLFVGRLVEKKGCEYLIRAMQSVQEAAPQAELVVIGDGPLRPSLEKLATSTLRRVKFLGLQTQEQIRDWMNQASVLSTPSVVAGSGDAEGFGMVFIEAQSMGLPVASFASGGIPEAVTHGETGLLAPERDWRALAANILTLLTDKSAWQQMSDKAQERVRREFDLRKQCTKLEGIYDELLSKQA